MIKSFRHKGLRLLFEEDDYSKVNAEHVPRLKNILLVLEALSVLDDDTRSSAFPSIYRLHSLKGNLQGFWAVTVRANWRIIFRFANGHVYDVDLVDYH